MKCSMKAISLLAIPLIIVFGIALAETSDANTASHISTDRWLISRYLFVIAFVATAPAIIDTIGSYALAFKTKEPPTGIPGVTRGIISVSIIVILSIFMIQMMVVDPHTYYEEQVGNVLSVLAGVLGTVSGFYFGGKSVREEDKARESPAEKLHQLNQLKDKELITLDEYNEKRAEILSSI